MPASTLQIIRDEHAAVAAVLRSLGMMIERGPGDEPERFFDVLRAMLFYIDEFPEKLHHPKESDLLFPRLQHLLLAWELIGESRRLAFTEATQAYAGFYLEHMRTEETQLLPAAQKALSAGDWAELDAAFQANRDPLAGGARDPCYDRLFTRIVLTTPAPIGVGAA